MSADQLNQLLIVYAAYLIAVASPGPSTLAIMGTAMRQGRLPAMAMALGVMTGSLVWASAAAAGLSTLLARHAEALFAIRIAGGLYLLWLAVRSARSALAARPSQLTTAPASGLTALYRRGILLHLTNPKSILGWVAIMSLGLTPDAPPAILPAILAGCAALGLVVFTGYAALFSTVPMGRAYLKARRWIEGALALVFGSAGLKLLLSRT